MLLRVLLALLLLGAEFKNISAQDKRHYNAAKADIRTYPFMVQVTRRTSTKHCGGTIISEYYVLSAAHCTGPNMSVSVNSSIWDGRDQIKYDIEEVIIHEQFNAQTLQNDIALLKIHGRFIFTSRVRPVRLAASQEIEEIINGAIGLLAGWGSTRDNEPDERPGYLTDTYTNIVSNTECASTFPQYPNEMCTKISEEVNILSTPCMGDGGGPLLIMKCRNEQRRAAMPEGRKKAEVEWMRRIPCLGREIPCSRPTYTAPQVIETEGCKKGQVLVMKASSCKSGYFDAHIVRCQPKPKKPPIHPADLLPVRPVHQPGHQPVHHVQPPVYPVDRPHIVPHPPVLPYLPEKHHKYPSGSPPWVSGGTPGVHLPGDRPGDWPGGWEGPAGSPPNNWPVTPSNSWPDISQNTPPGSPVVYPPDDWPGDWPDGWQDWPGSQPSTPSDSLAATPTYSQRPCMYIQVGVIAIHFSDSCTDPEHPYNLYPQVSIFRTWIYEKTGV